MREEWPYQACLHIFCPLLFTSASVSKGKHPHSFHRNNFSLLSSGVVRGTRSEAFPPWPACLRGGLSPSRLCRTGIVPTLQLLPPQLTCFSPRKHFPLPMIGASPSWGLGSPKPVPSGMSLSPGDASERWVTRGAWGPASEQLVVLQAAVLAGELSIADLVGEMTSITRSLKDG